MIDTYRVNLMAVVAIFCFAPAFWGMNAQAQISGAIFTTDIEGGTNINFFEHKEDVYLNGGPRKEGSAGLPDGQYYVQVTAPNGELLGTSLYLDELDPGLSETPINVVGGEFEFVYRLWDIVAQETVNGGGHVRIRPGYADTPNNGGVYKVWVSLDRDFTLSLTKTDNFKVKDDADDKAPPTEIVVAKFYDVDADGVWDGRDEVGGEVPIPNWHIELRLAGDDSLVSCGLTDASGEIRFLVDSDGTDYVVIETLVGNYTNTTPLSVPVTAATAFKYRGKLYLSDETAATIEVLFGNLCLVESTGQGRTPGFWSNTNGRDRLAACDPEWRDLINGLSLVWPDGSEVVIPGGDFDAAADVLQDLLIESSDSNMAYILTRQLAAVALNQSACGFIDSALVYVEYPMGSGSYVVLDDLIAEASALIAANPLTPGDDPSVAEARLAQEQLKDVFDAINNNAVPVYVISPTPCPFEPVPCPPEGT